MNEITFIYTTELYGIPIYKSEELEGFFVIMGSDDNDHRIYKQVDTLKEMIDYLNGIVIIDTFRK